METTPRSEQVVLDPASGSRMMYFDKADDRVVFGDIRTEQHILCDGRALNIAPDIEMDFRDLPYADGAFQVVVFDPPHLVRVGENAWMGKKYGRLDPLNWRTDLAEGFAECFRVLADTGVLIFKWNETQIPVSQILALTPHRPLVGHKTGKSAKTHWITFLKTVGVADV